MSAVKVDLAVEQGADTIISFTWLQADGITPVNLTGFTAKSQARSGPGGPVAFWTLTQVSGIVLGGVAGTIAMTVPASVTSGLSRGVLGDWDMILTSPGGLIYRFVYGNVSVTGSITI